MAAKGNEARGGSIVELDGEKYIVRKDKKGKPEIIAFGNDFNTFIICPPIQGNECPIGWDEECISQEIWCIVGDPG